jgi:hypothetical protein
MAIIDNTLAAQVPQFNPATPLAQAAQIQNAQAEAQANQFKQNQTEMGAEMRSLQPFVNTPEFPAKWAQAADRLRQRGVIDDQMHEQWANAPSPLLMKSIIAKTEDPALSFRKDEAKREQGNTDRSFGLQKTNADRTYGLAVRAADRLDDPTPDGFEANPLAKTDATQPKYMPLSGGPNDPNYLQSAAAAKAKIPRILAPGEAVVDMGTGTETYKNAGKGGEGGPLPPETADFAAEQILLGAKGVKTGYGRGAQGPEAIAQIDAAVARKAKERGITAADLVQRGIDLVGDTGRERTAATQEGRMASAGIEAQGAIKLGKEASDLVPRTSWVPVNKAIQAYQSNTSDPNLKRFGAANLTIINTYARAINPNGVGTVADKEHASEMLRTADGPEAYNAVLDQLNKEIEMAHKSPALARKSFKEERASRTGTKLPAPDRFKQLTGTGLSKDEAYSKMHEEGY